MKICARSSDPQLPSEDRSTPAAEGLKDSLSLQTRVYCNKDGLEDMGKVALTI